MGCQQSATMCEQIIPSTRTKASSVCLDATPPPKGVEKLIHMFEARTSSVRYMERNNNSTVARSLIIFVPGKVCMYIHMYVQTMHIVIVRKEHMYV